MSNYKFERKGSVKNGEQNGNGKFKQIEELTVFHEKLNLQDANTKFLIESAKYSLFCKEVLNARANEADTEVKNIINCRILT